MIHEVDESLRLLMRQEALGGTDIDILFEAPTKEWAGRRNTPTIDVYLYDIREDMGHRETGIIERRDPVSNRVLSRGAPPRWYKLSYLVTAWTQRPEDEHRLLSACLSCFLRHSVIPTEHLTGSLADLGAPVIVNMALPPPQERSISDIWSAMGGELKPSLDLVVTAPLDTGVAFHVGPPVLELPTVGLRQAPDDAHARNRVGPDGRLVPVGGPPADADGEADGEAAGGRRRRRKGAPRDGEAPDDTTMPEAWDQPEGHRITDPLPEEAVVASEDGKGRVFRVQGLPRPPKG